MESKRGNRMKKFIIAIAALLTSASVIASPSLGAVNKLGGTCTKVGTISGALICQKSGSKLLWAKYSAPKPAPSSADYITPQVLAALKVTKLPANLTPPIAKVPTDKSFWLDQACSVDFADVKTPDCQAGDPKGTKIMVVYGDSHASMWMTALNQIAIDSGYKIYLFAKLACPILEVPIWSYQLNRPFTECNDWQKLVLPKIADLHPDLLITTDQFKPAVTNGVKSDFDTPFLWTDQYPKALAHLKQIAKKVVVISNNPSMSTDSASCASRPGANIVSCSSGRSAADNHVINNIEQSAAKSLGIPFVDVVPWACSPDLCPVIINNIFVYFDQWHFTASYVSWLTPALKKALNL